MPHAEELEPASGGAGSIEPCWKGGLWSGWNPAQQAVVNQPAVLLVGIMMLDHPTRANGLLIFRHASDLRRPAAVQPALQIDARRILVNSYSLHPKE
jgi:hypothetical protein